MACFLTLETVYLYTTDMDILLQSYDKTATLNVRKWGLYIAVYSF